MTQMVDPRVDLKIVHRHSVLFHRNPHARVADQHIQPAIIRVSTKLSSVADSDPGSGAFLTPGSGIRDG